MARGRTGRGAYRPAGWRPGWHDNHRGRSLLLALPLPAEENSSKGQANKQGKQHSYEKRR